MLRSSALFTTDLWPSLLFLLCFLLSQDVVLERVLALDLTGTGHLEPFLCT